MGMFVGSEDTEVTVGSPGPRMMLGALGGDKGQKMSTRPGRRVSSCHIRAVTW